MVTNIRMIEVGRFFQNGNPYVCVIAVATDNKIVVSETAWRIPYDMETREAAARIADEIGCERWQYQSAWVLPDLDPRPFPIRHVDDLLDTEEDLP